LYRAADSRIRSRGFVAPSKEGESSDLPQGRCALDDKASLEEHAFTGCSRGERATETTSSSGQTGKWDVRVGRSLVGVVPRRKTGSAGANREKAPWVVPTAMPSRASGEPTFGFDGSSSDPETGACGAFEATGCQRRRWTIAPRVKTPESGRRSRRSGPGRREALGSSNLPEGTPREGCAVRARARAESTGQGS